MANYIGMDVHSKTCMFVVVNSAGKEIATARVNTSETEISKFIRSLRGRKSLTFEESQMSRWLHVFVKDEVDELIVCNPCFIPKRKGPKNDYQDNGSTDVRHIGRQKIAEVLLQSGVFRQNFGFR
jgi:hypothetical protein